MGMKRFALTILCGLFFLTVLAQKPVSQHQISKSVSLTALVDLLVEIPTYTVIPQIVNNVASPHKTGYLLTCVYGWNATQRRAEVNAYLSRNNGITWGHVLQDATTPWVSEVSCAFGPDGSAYIVTGASKRTGITRGHPFGAMHVYRSTDDGLSWQGPTTGPFVDWTATTVDTTRGPNRGRIYLFGHDIANGNGSWVGPAKPLLVSSDGGMSFTPPSFAGKWPLSGGGYPLGTNVLHDGTVVALYRRQQPAAYVPVLSEDGGKTHRELASIPKDSLVKSIAALSAGFTVDQSRKANDGRFYLAYPAIRSGKPVIMLSRSDDNGKSWRNSVALNFITDSVTTKLGFVSVAVNQNGILGVSWSQPQQGSQYFSFSRDGGDTFEPATLLSRDSTILPSMAQYIQHYLQTMGTYEPDVPRSDLPGASASGKGLSIRLTKMGLNAAQLSTDQSGDFHPIWLHQKNDGKLVLTTARVSIGEIPQKRNVRSATGLLKVTKRVLIDVVNQQFDATLGEYRISFTLTNSSDSTFLGPIHAVVTELTAGNGFTQAAVLDAANSETGVGAILTFERTLMNGQLLPGESTNPYQVTFRVKPKTTYESVWHQVESGETIHPVSVQLEIYVSKAIPE